MKLDKWNDEVMGRIEEKLEGFRRLWLEVDSFVFMVLELV